MQEVRGIGFLGIAVFSLVGISLAIASLVRAEWCDVYETYPDERKVFTFGLHEHCIKAAYAGQTYQQQCFDANYKPSLKKNIDAVKILLICGLVVGFLGLCFLVVWTCAREKIHVVTSAILLSAGGALVIAASLVYRFEVFIELENKLNWGISVFQDDARSPSFGDPYLSYAFWLCVASGVIFVVAGILGFIVGEISKTQKRPTTPGTVNTMPLNQYPNHYPNIAYISDTDRQTDK